MDNPETTIEQIEERDRRKALYKLWMRGYLSANEYPQNRTDIVMQTDDVRALLEWIEYLEGPHYEH